MLLALATVGAFALLLGLFAGVGMLGVAREQAAGESGGESGRGGAVAAAEAGRVGEAAAGESPAARSEPATEPKLIVPPGVAGSPPPAAAGAAAGRAGELGAGPQALPGAPAELRAAAALVGVDDHSRGGWVRRYGARGFSVATAGEPRRLPPGVQLTMLASHFYPWSPVTTDPRGLNVPDDPPRRTAGQWFAWEQFSLDVDLREAGRSYQVALYLLDWDSDARAQRLDVTDAATGAVLLTRTDDHFHDGRYVVLRLSGHVVLRITKTAGANCTLSGVFLDDPPGPSSGSTRERGRTRRRSCHVGPA